MPTHEDEGEDVGDEDKEGVGGRNKDEDNSEGEGEDTGGDLVSAIFFPMPLFA